MDDQETRAKALKLAIRLFSTFPEAKDTKAFGKMPMRPEEYIMEIAKDFESFILRN
jgi:hypothetical protein